MHKEFCTFKLILFFLGLQYIYVRSSNMVFPLNSPVLDNFSLSDKPQIEEITVCPWQQDCANTPPDFPNFPSNPAK